MGNLLTDFHPKGDVGKSFAVEPLMSFSLGLYSG